MENSKDCSEKMKIFGANDGTLFPKVLITEKGQFNWSNYNTVTDIQPLVNYIGWTCALDLKNAYGGLYEKFRALKLIKKINFPNFNSGRKDWSNINTQSEFQNFIDSHSEIQTKQDFHKKYKTLFEKARVLGFLSKLKFPVMTSRTNWSLYTKTKETSKKYLEDHGIDNRGYPGISQFLSILKEKGWLDELLPLQEKQDYSSINTIGEINQFIKDNDIPNPKDMRERFPGLDGKIRRVLKIKNCDLNYPHFRKSTLEIKVERMLKRNNINYIYEARFPETGKLKFDFWLPDHYIMLGPGGEHHLLSIDKFGGEEYYKTTLEHDKIKKEYCDSHGISVLYYFSFKPEYREQAEKVLKDNGYQGEYYLDFDLFEKRLLELIEEKKKKGE